MLKPRQPQPRPQPLRLMQIAILLSILLSLTVITILILALGWNALWVMVPPTLFFLALANLHRRRNPRIR